MVELQSVKSEYTYLRDYKQPNYLIPDVKLTVQLDENYTRITSELRIKKSSKNVDERLWLDGGKLELLDIKLDGEKLSTDKYTVMPNGIEVAELIDDCVLSISVAIDPKSNMELMGLYQSKGNFCSQCEPQGFRNITYFIDRPDILSRYTVVIIGDASLYPVMLSNGNMVAKTVLESGLTQVIWEDPSLKPCYLFALVAGKYDVVEKNFITADKRNVLLQVYVEPGLSKQADIALEALYKVMHWDEKTYGRVYDLDQYMIVAVSDFNMGAMENKGLNVFNSRYILADSKIATDQDIMNVESVIAHEYCHNWSGNRVTCRDWFQISLKEGLTIFRDQHFTADMTSAAIKRIDDVRFLRAHQFVEDASPVAHAVQPKAYMEINNFYTATVYHKGAELIRMLETMLGWDMFRAGLDLYFSRHDGQAVTIEEFVKAMEDISKKDLSQFRLWYHQPGTPEVKVDFKYDDATRKCELFLTQSNPLNTQDSQPLLIPLKLSLLDMHANEQLFTDSKTGVSTKETVVWLDAEKEKFVFSGVSLPPILSIGRGFSAPINLTYSRSKQEKLLLLRGETDSFCRWEISQQLMMDSIFCIYDNLTSDKSYALDKPVFDEYNLLLQDDELDPALIAEILTPPSINQLLAKIPGSEVLDIYYSYQTFKRSLAQYVQSALFKRYQNIHKSMGRYSYKQSQVADRKLKNVCLHYLLLVGDSDLEIMCFDQYKHADNMTDVLASLSAINQVIGKIRVEMLQDFSEKWKHNNLVMDKWFGLRAMAETPDILDEIKVLMDHPCFNINNPNTVSALLGVFSRCNFTGFHAHDGSGYKFLIEHILAIDTSNPHISSRLVQPLLHNQFYDSKRRGIIKTYLEQISVSKGLSKGLYELVHTTLGSMHEV